MNNSCCINCQAKATKKKMKNSKKTKDESDDKEDVKEEQKVSENEKPKTDSTEGKGPNETSDEKDKKKKKNIVTWQHASTKKDKDYGKKLLSETKGVNTARPMMYHGGPNPLHRWPMSAGPRSRFPPFPRPPMYGPYGGGGGGPQMYGPYGGCGGPLPPYQSMTRPTKFDGYHMSPYPHMSQYPHMPPYPHMAAPFYPPYWQTRPYTDANPMTRYTSYADNYSFCFI